MAVLAMAVACEELYGPEPTPIAPDQAAGVEITVSDVKDSSFVVTVTPSAQVSYYSWLVDESPKAAALDSAVLYKVGYQSVTQGSAKWTSEATSTTFTVKGLMPNTTYQVYAVTGSVQGHVGSVVNTSVKTTDGIAPGYVSYTTKAHQVEFTFSEAVARKAEAGAITIPYYAPYSAEFKTTATAAGEITVPEDSIKVAGNKAQISVPGLPTGSYWTISIPKGAFVDAVGQDLPGYATEYVMAKDKDGKDVPTVKGFNGKVDYVELPMLGKMELKAFTEWDGGFLIPIESEYALAGFSSKKFITVTYEHETENSVETVVYTLKPEADYNVTSLGLVVNLPAEPTGLGDNVTITVPAGGLYDVFGNDSEEWEHTMKYSYGYTLKDIVGTYAFAEASVYGPTYDSFETLVIKESDNTKKGNVMFTSYGGFKCEKTPIYAEFDGDAGLLTIPSGQIFASEVDGEDTYYYAFSSGDIVGGEVVPIKDDVVFDVLAPNTIVGPYYYYGLFVLDAEGELLGCGNAYYSTMGELAEETEEETPSTTAVRTNIIKSNVTITHKF